LLFGLWGKNPIAAKQLPVTHTALPHAPCFLPASAGYKKTLRHLNGSKDKA
jgi:hypothetical protein